MELAQAFVDMASLTGIVMIVFVLLLQGIDLVLLHFQQLLVGMELTLNFAIYAACIVRGKVVIEVFSYRDAFDLFVGELR